MSHLKKHHLLKLTYSRSLNQFLRVAPALKVVRIHKSKAVVFPAVVPKIKRRKDHDLTEVSSGFATEVK